MKNNNATKAHFMEYGWPRLKEAVEEEGGCTFSLATMRPVKLEKGYGFATNKLKEMRLNLKGFNVETVWWYVEEVHRGESPYLGVWKDEEDVVWLDVGAVRFDREEAEAVCREHGQVAMWDFGKKEVVWL